MSERPLTERAILSVSGETRAPLRGRTGKLYGVLDLATLVIEVRRGGAAEPTDRIDLTPLLRAAGVLREEPPPTISPL